jgi:two-component system phosphate regulon response regulator PhoB
VAEATILVVEDEKDIRDLLVYNLKRESFAVLSTDNGVTAVELARTKHPDLMLLDLMLPDLDGLSVCKHMQRDPALAAIPVLMLTARGEELDRVVGLELGASDYIVKPFSVREVILRIRIALKRSHADQEQPFSARCGPIAIDAGSHDVRVNGKAVELTVTEFRLLEDLIRHRGKVRTREQLLDVVWGHSFEGYSRTVDTHVRRLRAKLGEGAEMIETIRGVGYRAKGNET